MERYQLIKNLPNLAVLIAGGVVPLTIATKLQVYEKYLDLKRTKAKAQSIKETADYFDLSDSQIYKVVSFMES